VIRVSEDPDFSWRMCRPSAGDVVAAVGGSIIYEQQFPVPVRLGEYAFDRFLEKLLFVQEDHYN
jgi:hypothetical protein